MLAIHEDWGNAFYKDPLNIPFSYHKSCLWQKPQGKKSSEVMSGERGGQGIGPSRPIHLPGIFWSKICPTFQLQWGGVPSCWKMTSSSKYSIWGITTFSIISRYTISKEKQRKKGRWLWREISHTKRSTLDCLANVLARHMVFRSPFRQLCRLTLPETW